jgi:hypothetical protein
MANGITGGLESILGLDTNAGTAELQQAIQALQAVGVPNAAQLTLPELQKYVAAGVLSPSQYQAIQENPQAYQQAFNAASDTTGKNAQSAALQQLGNIVQSGGSTPINQANLMHNIDTTNQAMQAARSGIEENAQERGVAGGGQEFLAKLMNEQNNAQTANTGAVNAASNNAQLALQALANTGTLGSTMQGQANQSQQAQAEAARQIAQYNSQLQSAANQYNTQYANSAQAQNLATAQGLSNANVGNTNYRTQYNAQIPQTVYNDQMGKAQGLAGAYGNMGNLKQQQAASQNQFTGSLLGAGAGLAGDYMLGQGMAKSGAMANQYGGANGPPPNANTNQYSPWGYAEGGIVASNQMDRQNYTLPQVTQGGETGQTQGNPSGITPQQLAIMQILATHGGQVPQTQPASLSPQQMGLMQQRASQGYAMGGDVKCYAEGGEVHDHAICMKVGGTVPGEPNVGGDSTQNDTVPAMLSPHEIVLPRSVSTAPDAPQQAAQFVGQIKGQMPPEAGPMIGQAISQMAQPQTRSFGEVIKMLEDNGLSVRLESI